MTPKEIRNGRLGEHWNDGSVAVETAIALTILLLLTLGIIEFAECFWQWNTMLLAVEEGGRRVMINNASCDTTCAEDAMKSILTSASVCTTPAADEMCVSAASDGSNMTLTATYGFDFLGLGGPFTLVSQGTVPLD